jgi:hypothetical protein
MLRRLSVVLLAVWAALAGLTAAGAEPVYPPGLRVGLEPPADFKPSTQFSGFEDSEHKAAITILDLPGRAYEEIERSVFAQNQSGLTDLKRESFPFASGVGFLVSGRATENGVAVRRWFLLATAIGGPAVQDLTTLINVTVPESATAVYSDAVIRKTLASVTFRPIPIQEQLGMMPFKLNELAGFRIMRVLREGVVILTDGPSDQLDVQPYVIVSVGRGGPAQPGDRSLFARDLLATAPLRDLNIQQSESMRIGGQPGSEIRAQASTLTGSPVLLVQWVRFGTSGFLRVVAVGRKDDWNTLFTRFRAVRDGIESR